MAIADAAGFPVSAHIESASPHEVKLVEATIDSGFTFRLRSVGTKLLQNHPVFNARSNNFNRLGPKALSAES
jgi:hypothetical protein